MLIYWGVLVYISFNTALFLKFCNEIKDDTDIITTFNTAFFLNFVMKLGMKLIL